MTARVGGGDGMGLTAGRAPSGLALALRAEPYGFGALRRFDPIARPSASFSLSSTRSLIQRARRFLPATASIRSSVPSGKRTMVTSSSLAFGTFAVVTDIGSAVKTPSKAISLIDIYPISD